MASTTTPRGRFVLLVILAIRPANAWSGTSTRSQAWLAFVIVAGVVIVVVVTPSGLLYWYLWRRGTRGAAGGSLPSDNPGAVELQQVSGAEDGAGGTGVDVLPSQQA
ncbi:hypothetical protein Q9L58_004343 [Maublancomyces gigas]|uniref:Uncharacterized protein n=1 Tax=Discina gigas TaxID=1032678 RepID=A0ABR3GLD3_9PEZI